MESRLTTLGMGLVGGGIEQKSKRTHGHGQVWRLQGEALGRGGKAYKGDIW